MEQGIFGAFRQAVVRLTSDPQLQKDLMQEMFVHLLDLRRTDRDQSTEWYVRQCDLHAREYLERSRGTELVTDARPNGGISGKQFTEASVELVRPRLSARQLEVFEWLHRGYGIRETARQLGISHPAVIKHRNRIARTLQELVREESPTQSFAGMSTTVDETALRVA